MTASYPWSSALSGSMTRSRLLIAHFAESILSDFGDGRLGLERDGFGRLVLRQDEIARAPQGALVGQLGIADLRDQARLELVRAPHLGARDRDGRLLAFERLHQRDQPRDSVHSGPDSDEPAVTSAPAVAFQASRQTQHASFAVHSRPQAGTSLRTKPLSSR